MQYFVAKVVSYYALLTQTIIYSIIIKSKKTFVP
nr:MAG TPA: hypothetical protein [Caudoviricetes sp.]